MKTITPGELAGDQEEEDPFYTMLERSGCAKQHYTLQDCMIDKKDWRQCQEEVKEFKACMEKSAAEKQKAASEKL